MVRLCAFVFIGLSLQSGAGSATANGNNNLDPVAVGQRHLGMATARHDLAVAFDGDALAGMP